MTSPGPEIERVDIDSDGVVTNTWTDGEQASTQNPSEGISVRNRARGIATHEFFERKRRLWPRSRV